ncbi:MAG: cob(I)yrinic acid a,c-diamide adenosyltransferase [Candidatus Erginobacter occultus]|nr:cob(I)yrinic acid a,c-diamide adenosyltransferase [Candidatus Erginobacter occultus]
MLHIYTGNGPGKTTAALGLALRSLGRGKRVALVQFLKKRPSGEILSLARFKNCLVRRFGKEEFLLDRPPDPEDFREAAAGMEETEKILRERSADLLILDEINVALDLELLPPARVIKLIADCPPGIDLVLTGRNCPAEILDRADYAVESREIRHPFRQGKGPREGIEF